MTFRNPHIRTTRSALDVRAGRRDFYAVHNATAAKAEIDVFDEVGFFGITASDFARDLDAITAPEILLRVNSPGGDVFDGIAIFNMLKAKDANITARVYGLAASAASFIVMAADRVEMATHAQMMIHDAWGMAIGNAATMRDAADFLERQSDVIAGIYSARAGNDRAHWLALMAEETWFTDSEAVDAGLADAVVDEQAVKNSFDLSVFRHPPGAQEPVTVNKDEPQRPDGRQRASAQLAVAAAELEVATWRR